MEIGSFIELDFPKGKELYKGTHNIARLNTGRAAIYHASRLLDCKTVYLPLYQCECVSEFLCRKGLNVKYYRIDERFNPDIDGVEPDACVVLTNYFGVMGQRRIHELSDRFERVIVDNSQALYAQPATDRAGVYSVYSARKFVGVPDGAYVLGSDAEKYVREYERGTSSDTSLFLLQRVEYGCEGKAYESRMRNEERLDREDIMRMSVLTQTLLDGYDYEQIAAKRRENFDIASAMFGGVNLLDPLEHYDESCVPMVYPLMLEDDDLLRRLLVAKHFQGHWWSYILDRAEPDSFEYRLSRYMVPITIDQRYGRKELEYIGSNI